MNRSLPTSQHPPEFPSPQRARRPESIRGSRSLLRDLNVTLVMELVRRAEPFLEPNLLDKVS